MSRICYILSSFPVISETFIVNEIRELRKQGVDIALVSFSRQEGFANKEARELVRDTIYLKDRNKLFRIFKLLFSHAYFFVRNPFHYLRVFYLVRRMDEESLSLFLRISYLAFVVKKLGVRGIHTHFASSTAECAMLVSMITGIPYSFTVHAYDIFIKPRLVREKVERARFVISISEFNRDFIRERFFDGDNRAVDKIRVIHCGVDLDKVSPYQASGFRRKGNRGFVIFSTGRLLEKKGHRYLIEACRILMEKGYSDFVCKILGDGPLREELHSLTLRLGLGENIRFLGALPQHRVFENLRECDLFVLPCVVARNGDMDGIPVSIMEAMALKKPVVSTSISGIPELVKDGAGILVPPGDSSSLAQAILRIMKLDPEERALMGEKGYEIVQREFNLRENVERIKELFLNQY